MSASKPKILFILTGSIACFKACQLLSKLVQKNFDVQVVATKSALEFVGEATLEGLSGKPVASDIFARGQMMDHIHLDRWADLVVVCPATANYINRIANGIGEDLATTLYLAHDFKKPFLIAPAMNSMMYLHPATQESLKRLKSWGAEVLESASGVLACGETGYGRLLEPDQLLIEIEKSLNREQLVTTTVDAKSQTRLDIKPLRALVTAGGTFEPIDNVRVLTNLSTGKTGQRIAGFLGDAGFDVDLLISEMAAAEPSNSYAADKFSTFKSLQEKMKQKISDNQYDVVVHAAAVSDYHIQEISADGQRVQNSGKIPSGSEMTLKLSANPKIINEIKSWSPSSVLIGFKLTSGATVDEQNAKVQKVFNESQADFVIGNDLTDMLNKKTGHGFNIFSKNGNVVAAKDVTELNQQILARLGDLAVQRGT